MCDYNHVQSSSKVLFYMLQMVRRISYLVNHWNHQASVFAASKSVLFFVNGSHLHPIPPQIVASSLIADALIVPHKPLFSLDNLLMGDLHHVSCVVLSCPSLQIIDFHFKNCQIEQVVFGVLGT